jgi:hypothetical protein
MLCCSEFVFVLALYIFCNFKGLVQHDPGRINFCKRGAICSN